MAINKIKFAKVVEAAKAKAAGSPEWLRAIEKATARILDGGLVVTLFADDTALVTSLNGSYRVNGACDCAARTNHCYHRAAKRLMEIYEAEPEAVAVAPEITRSVERDVVTRRRVKVTRVDGWVI
jgi:nucleotide-binding universal stress UspA family protein